MKKLILLHLLFSILDLHSRTQKKSLSLIVIILNAFFLPIVPSMILFLQHKNFLKTIILYNELNLSQFQSALFSLYLCSCRLGTQFQPQLRYSGVKSSSSQDQIFRHVLVHPFYRRCTQLTCGVLVRLTSHPAVAITGEKTHNYKLSFPKCYCNCCSCFVTEKIFKLLA